MIALLLLGGAKESVGQFKFPSLFKKNNNVRRSIFQPYSSVGVGVGTSHYYGDLAPYRDVLGSTFKTLRWNVSANYTRHFTPRLSGRIGLAFARLGADDNLMEKKDNYVNNYIRNLHFRNDVKELSVVGIYNFTPGNRSYNRRPQVQPYIFTGLVLFAHNPRAKTPAFPETPSTWVSLQPIGTEGQGQPGYGQPYSLVQAGIPLGLGIRYKINDRWDVSAEGGLRFTFTKYLDDVGGDYADPNDLSPEAQLMGNRTLEAIAARTGKDRTERVRRFLVEQRGFPNDPGLDPFGQPISGFADRGDNRSTSTLPDSYILTSFTIHYILPGKIKCPPIR
ncbi:MAG: DUF6089 family protein [Cytophagaceae bacterium]|nr:DUF6089 family protein [Cytophagaceae bacterium]